MKVKLLTCLQNGVHYWFTDKETMQAEIEDGQFLEFAHVHDNIYGTSIRAVRDVAAQGKCCILDIDVQGARQVLIAATCRICHNATACMQHEDSGAIQDTLWLNTCHLNTLIVALQVRRAGLKAIFVFVAPPSLEELERRLRGRGTESEEQIGRRLANAKEEMARWVAARLPHDMLPFGPHMLRCFWGLQYKPAA